MNSENWIDTRLLQPSTNHAAQYFVIENITPESDPILSMKLRWWIPFDNYTIGKWIDESDQDISDRVLYWQEQPEMPAFAKDFEKTLITKKVKKQ